MDLLDVDAIFKFMAFRSNIQLKFLRRVFQPTRELELFDIVWAVAAEDGFPDSQIADQFHHIKDGVWPAPFGPHRTPNESNFTSNDTRERKLFAYIRVIIVDISNSGRSFILATYRLDGSFAQYD